MNRPTMALTLPRPQTHPRTEPAPRQPVQPTAPAALWFCIHLPRLALQVCELDSAVPGVVFETIKGRSVVHDASPVAQAAGVQPGMALAQARALCENLQARVRRPRAERQALIRLAGRMSRFTPTISLAPPRALLLEVRASLRLFGGPEGLREALREELAAQDIHAAVAAAPTPLAALWLAGRDQNCILTDKAALRSTLGRLPLACLPLPAALLRRLTKTGVRELQDLWRLPRDGLARRFGPELLLTLDRALGKESDPRPTFVPAKRFHAVQDLPWEVADTALLLPAIERLVIRLCRFLRAHDAGIAGLRLDLRHSGQPASRLDIGLRLATRDHRHLMRLVEEHLDRLRLPAPVIALGLASGPIQPFVAGSPALDLAPAPLPAGEGQEEQSWRRLLEQLEARLGADSLRPLQTRADHRPEQAFAYREPATPKDAFVSARRPLWLLAHPRPLGAAHRPRLVSGPERIESGWWDGGDIRRDYYVAQASDGRRLWIFRDLNGGKEWYLHGLFN